MELLLWISAKLDQFQLPDILVCVFRIFISHLPLIMGLSHPGTEQTLTCLASARWLSHVSSDHTLHLVSLASTPTTFLVQPIQSPPSGILASCLVINVADQEAVRGQYKQWSVQWNRCTDLPCVRGNEAELKNSEELSCLC